eukprot:gene20922-27118_t
MSKKVVSLLDYGAGNVRSLKNAIKSLNYEIYEIVSADDINNAEMIIFPGVGNFGQAMQSIINKGWYNALIDYIKADRPFFGICIGMQCLFEGSDESPNDKGLGIIPGRVTRFSNTDNKIRIPQIGWNGITSAKSSCILDNVTSNETVYFVHSYCALPNDNNLNWILSVTDYANQRYISSVQKGNVIATQFHPEKSGKVGLAIIKSFLDKNGEISQDSTNINKSLIDINILPETTLAKRIIACLDVRSNDNGDLIVTKGDQYDVREDSQTGRGQVRNLGKPVALCKRYYDDGADEIVFLNITSFRQGVLDDLPMLQILEQSSENVFVPLTVGGGIREYVDESKGIKYSALEVAGRYFRAGADKVSIGSDAVYTVEDYLSTGVKTGQSSIELISSHYGAQAVVVSVDPKRVYVNDPNEAVHKTVVNLRDNETGPNGERYCWWQVTVKGGREARDLDAILFAKACQDLGAGEIMLNCIDMDGQGKGYDIPLISAVQKAVNLPVIASSGAGHVDHFKQVFEQTDVAAALAAGIFHRNEITINQLNTTIPPILGILIPFLFSNPNKALTHGIFISFAAFVALVVGNAKCGKTSIISKYVYRGNLNSKYKTTIGADFIRKDVLFDINDSNSIGVRLQLWDIAGQDRFQKLTRAYFTNARGVVIVCDVSRDGTIDAVKNWKNEIDTWSNISNCDLPVVLFANKADLLTNPQDAFKTGATMERICRELGFKGWWITSAKSGDNLDEGFHTLIKEILEIDLKSTSNKENKQTNTIKLTNNNIRRNDYDDNDEDDDYSDYDNSHYSQRLRGGDCC